MEATVYLHSNKETMYKKGEALGLEGDALRNFAHACYEVKIGLTVDAAGNASISTVDSFPLLKTLPSVPPESSEEGSQSPPTGEAGLVIGIQCYEDAGGFIVAEPSGRTLMICSKGSGAIDAYPMTPGQLEGCVHALGSELLRVDARTLAAPGLEAMEGYEPEQAAFDDWLRNNKSFYAAEETPVVSWRFAFGAFMAGKRYAKRAAPVSPGEPPAAEFGESMEDAEDGSHLTGLGMGKESAGFGVILKDSKAGDRPLVPAPCNGRVKVHAKGGKFVAVCSCGFQGPPCDLMPDATESVWVRYHPSTPQAGVPALDLEEDGPKWACLGCGAVGIRPIPPYAPYAEVNDGSSTCPKCDSEELYESAAEALRAAVDELDKLRAATPPASPPSGTALDPADLRAVESWWVDQTRRFLGRMETATQNELNCLRAILRDVENGKARPIYPEAPNPKAALDGQKGGDRD